VPRADLRTDVTLESLGLSSLLVIDITVGLERRLGRQSKTLLFEHRTLGALARALVPRQAGPPARRLRALPPT
jgi:polyketide synthase PksN